MTLHVEWDAIGEAREKLRQAEAGFGGLTGPVRRYARDAVEAAGEFAAEVSPGAEGFTASWEAVLAMCRDTCDVTAANLGAMTVDLEATDAAAARPEGSRPTGAGPVAF
jgi:hypothetical protein